MRFANIKSKVLKVMTYQWHVKALRGSECRYKQNSKPKMHVETREVGESLVAPASPLSIMLCIYHVSRVCL